MAAGVVVALAVAGSAVTGWGWWVDGGSHIDVQRSALGGGGGNLAVGEHLMLSGSLVIDGGTVTVESTQLVGGENVTGTVTFGGEVHGVLTIDDATRTGLRPLAGAVIGEGGESVVPVNLVVSFWAPSVSGPTAIEVRYRSDRGADRVAVLPVHVCAAASASGSVDAFTAEVDAARSGATPADQVRADVAAYLRCQGWR